MKLLILLLCLPPQVPALKVPAQVPPVQEIKESGQWETYLVLRARAIKENIPLVVTVGYAYPTVPAGCISCRCDYFPGVSSGIVVGVPKDGELWRIDLPADASAAQIKQAVESIRNPPKTKTSFAPRVNFARS